MIYKRNILGLGERIADPINSLDYPYSIPDDTVVIWISFGRWPDADRWVRYLSKTLRDPFNGFALLTHSHRDAARFASTQEALAFLAEQNKKRPQPWRGLNVTTGAVLKVRCGYHVEA